MFTRKPWLLALALLLTLSCGKREDGEACTLDGNCERSGGEKKQEVQVNPGVISCSITPDKASIAPGETLGLTFSVSGGSGIYSIPSQVSSFSGSTTIFNKVVVKNSSGVEVTPSSNIAVTKTVVVYDSNGAKTSCTAKYTVTGSSTSGSSLACVIAADNYNPQVGEIVNFTVRAWGGSSSTYTFDPFLPRQGEAPKSMGTVTTVNPGVQSLVSHTYTWTGYADPAVRVTNGSASTWCEIPNRYMYVRTKVNPSLYVDWRRNPSDLENEIIVDINTLNFKSGATLTYMASESEPGVEVSHMNGESDDVFLVKRTDALDHNSFKVTFKVVADNSTEAQQDVYLSFKTALNCSMSAAPNVFATVGANFVVTGTGGQDLDIYDVSAPAGVTVVKSTSGSAGVASLTFPSIGLFYVQVRANKRGDTTKLCNDGSSMTALVLVNPAPSTLTGCEIRTNVSRSIVDAPVRVDITKKGGGTDINGYLFTLTAAGNSVVTRGAYPNGLDTNSIELKWLNAGQGLLLSGSVKELSTGKTVACQSYISVDAGNGLLTEVFQLPKNGSLDNGGLTKNQGDFYSCDINVSARRSDCGDRKGSHLAKYNYSNDCQYPGVANRKEWFKVVYTGKIYAPTDGNYAFKFLVDDGVRLYINDQLIVNYNGLHSPQWSTEGNIHLSPGTHKLRVEYYQGPHWEIANQFYWRPHYQGGYSIVPASNLFRP